MGKPFGFGARLAAERARRGLRQADVGKGLGTDGVDVSKSVVYGWEKEQHYPRVDQFRAICDLLEVSADQLLYGVSAELPFSRELSAKIAAVDPSARRELENYMRGYFRMAPVTDVQETQVTHSDDVGPNHTDESSGTTDVPVQKRGAILDRLIRGDDGSRQSGSVQKPRRRGNS